MTTLTITPDLAKKKMKVDGVVAAGEKVAVTVKGFGDKSVTDTRLRVVCGRETIAMFPVPHEEGEEAQEWTVVGGDLTCELDLFTVQAEKATMCGCANCLFILDNIEAATLYATRDHEVLKWIKRRGTDIPIDLDGYADFVAQVREEIDSFELGMTGSWSAYKSEMSSAWNNYKQTIQSQYDSFTQTVRGLVDDKASAADLASHVGNKNNPHDVKIAQIPQLRGELDNLGAQITNESVARMNADNTLRESVTAEHNRAISRENDLEGAIVCENQRAVSVETQLDLDIRQLGDRMDDAIHVLRGKTYGRPSSDRERTELIVELITALGGTVS